MPSDLQLQDFLSPGSAAYLRKKQLLSGSPPEPQPSPAKNVAPVQPPLDSGLKPGAPAPATPPTPAAPGNPPASSAPPSPAPPAAPPPTTAATSALAVKPQPPSAPPAAQTPASAPSATPPAQPAAPVAGAAPPAPAAQTPPPPASRGAAAEARQLADAEKHGAVIRNGRLIPHPDGQGLLHHAGFVTVPAPGSPGMAPAIPYRDDAKKGVTVPYRDDHGRHHPIPVNEITRVAGPDGGAEYHFVVGSRPVRVPEDSKSPIFQVDQTGKRHTTAADGTRRELGNDPRTMAQNGVAPRVAAADQSLQEKLAQGAALRQQLQQKQAQSAAVQQRLDAAHQAVTAADQTTGPHSQTQRIRAREEVIRAESALESHTQELQALQKQHDAHYSALAHEQRARHAEIGHYQRGAAASPHDAPWQKDSASLQGDPRVTNFRLIAAAEKQDPASAEAMRRALVPPPTQRLFAAAEKSFGSAQPAQGQSMTLHDMLMQAPGMTQGQGARQTSVDQAAAARATAQHSLGITDPENVRVTRGADGRYTLSRSGADGSGTHQPFATLDPGTHRITLAPGADGQLTQAALDVVKSAPAGTPVYFPGGQPPLSEAQVSDLIQKGITATTSATDRKAADAALTQAGLSPEGISQMVNEGRLSVQDGQLLNGKLNSGVSSYTQRDAADTDRKQDARDKDEAAAALKSQQMGFKAALDDLGSAKGLSQRYQQAQQTQQDVPGSQKDTQHFLTGYHAAFAVLSKHRDLMQTLSDTIERDMTGKAREGDEEALAGAREKLIDLPDDERRIVLAALHNEAQKRGALNGAAKGGKLDINPFASSFWQQTGEAGWRLLDSGFSGNSHASSLDALKSVPTTGRVTFAGDIRTAEDARRFVEAEMIHTHAVNASLAGDGPGILPREGREMTLTPEQTRLIEDAKSRVEREVRTAQEIKALGSAVDPVPNLFASTLGSSATMMGLMAVSRGAAAPIIFNLYKGTEYEELSLKYPDASHEARLQAATLSAALQTAGDYVGVKAFSGLNIGKLLANPQGLTAAVIGRGLGRAGLSYGVENAIEAGQDIATPAIIQALKLDFPGFDWEKEQKDFWKGRADVAVGMLPLTLLGLGAASVKDYANGRALLSDDASLGRLGLSENDRKAIMDAAQRGDTDTAQRLLQEGFKKRDPAIAAEFQGQMDAETEKLNSTAMPEGHRKAATPAKIDPNNPPPPTAEEIAQAQAEVKAGFDKTASAQAARQQMESIEYTESETVTKRSANKPRILREPGKPSVFYKPNSGLNPKKLRAGIDPSTMGHREVAASKLAEAIGSTIVPPTTLKAHGGDIGSGQVFQEGMMNGSEAEASEHKLLINQKTEAPANLPDKLAEEWQFMDDLLMHVDRHRDNYMLSFDGKHEVNDVALVDNGLSLPDNPGVVEKPFPGPREGQNISLANKMRLQHLIDNEAAIRESLRPHLGEGALDGLFARAKALLKRGKYGNFTLEEIKEHLPKDYNLHSPVFFNETH